MAVAVAFRVATALATGGGGGAHKGGFFQGAWTCVGVDAGVLDLGVLDLGAVVFRVVACGIAAASEEVTTA
jgi:hypothetical protein